MIAGQRTTAGRRGILALALGAALCAALPEAVEAQYFGRNKVQYDKFDFRVLKTDHFDIHYYPEEGEAIEDLARMAERWYERFARTFQHEFEQPKPLIIYADHPDFQQTNTLQGSIGEGTGGVTESLKNRVILPMTGSYWDTDHVLGHELVHAFQYNIAQTRRGGGIQGLATLPLWLVEGMAEYLSVGRDDPLTAMWLRDAVRSEDFPTIRDMTRESRFFPYRFGQALWAYVGGEYGDDAVMEVYRRALRIGFQPAIGQVLGLSIDTLSAQWARRVEQQYIPLMATRTAPDDLGTKLLSPASGSGAQNLSPSLSPDGNYLAFLSEKDLFSIDLYMADARSGRIIRKLASADADPHSDALRYVEAAGTWSPDSELFAYVVFSGGDNEIVVVTTDGGDVVQRIKPEGLGAMNNPAWSPDGRYLAFTGFQGGMSDLFLYDFQEESVTRLTEDRFADFQPAWSPDGTTIAFASDRGAQTDFDRLVYSEFQLSLLDVDTKQVRVLPVFGDVRHSNPQFSPDGESLYFLSDQDGFSDIYELDFEAAEVRRLTRVATGVSGITDQSPALSVSARTGEMAFSVFTGFEIHIHTLPAGVAGQVVQTTMADASRDRGRQLPPANPDRFNRVAAYLADAETGLPMAGTFRVTDAAGYSPALQLDYLGQPSVGVGTSDAYGTYVGGGASAFFSDLLGNQLLGVALQAQGTVKDIGGQVIYADLSRRWNIGGGISRIPYQLLAIAYGEEQAGTAEQPILLPYYSYLRQRIFVSSAMGQVSYPLSTSRRLEFGGGVVRYSYDFEEDRYYITTGGYQRIQHDELEPDPLNLVQASVAYVGDNAFFALVGPVRGGRFRFEVQATTGSVDYVTAIADWRRYWQPNLNLTVAARGLHYGRYGNLDRSDVIRPLFLGYETFVRGYSYESFDSQVECLLSAQEADPNSELGQSSCPVLDRLFGNRLAVANVELRIPLLGVEQYGLINFPYLPTELILFQDAGFAYNSNDDFSGTDLFSRVSGRRVPVFSTGVGARFNVLGFLIVEAYYAQPWQRPDKGRHWGFQIAPGW